MLTLDFIREQFDIINKKHFDGKLLTPRFEITHVKNYLGQYHWQYSYDSNIFSDSVIRISDMFDRTDNEIANTVAHEAIHLYIRQNKIRDTRPHHGKVFNAVADRLNKEGGFHIARTDSVKGCGLRDKENMREWIIASFKDSNNKYFRFAINKNYLNRYLDYFEAYPSHYGNAYIIKSSDDKEFAHYPDCRKSVRGFFITEKEFNDGKKKYKVIHEYQTLNAR